ncbi:unnamed protein product [Discula destructiva]
MPISRQETGLSLSRATEIGSGLVYYIGSCHCGRNRFEARLPEIKRATSCSCSLCHRSGYLWAFPGAEDVEYTRGSAETLETFDTESLSHEFCTVCGTGLYGTHKVGPLQGRPGVNVRAILDVNPFHVEAEKADIPSSFPDTPAHLLQALKETESFSKLSGNKKVYTGSCQCGNVAFAVKTAPLNKIEVKEDNCSICVRRAATSIYPDRDQVLLLGKDKTTTYEFGRKFNQTPFCATCGVAVYGVAVGPPQSLVDRLPVEKQRFVEQQRRIQPLYVRAMDGVDWEGLKVERSDEGTEGYSLTDV